MFSRKRKIHLTVSVALYGGSFLLLGWVGDAQGTYFGFKALATSLFFTAGSFGLIRSLLFEEKE